MRGYLSALLVGIVGAGLALFLLLPVGGVDSDPPVCSSALGYSVPCSPVWGFGTAVVVGLLSAWAAFRLAGHGRRS